MSIYIINIAPDVEKIMMDSLRSHLYDEVHFKDIYPNFGNIRVSSVHPFSILLEQQIIGTGKVPTNLFPSVTLIENISNRNPELPHLSERKDVEITDAEVADITANRDKYIISDADLAILVTATSEGGTVWADGIESYIRGSFIAEIWSENMEVKNRLFDLVRNFLMGIWKYAILESENLRISDSIQGERSGLYNYDFGKVLYGSTMSFEVDYAVMQYKLDTDVDALTGIIHTEKEITDHSG